MTIRISREAQRVLDLVVAALPDVATEAMDPGAPQRHADSVLMSRSDRRVVFSVRHYPLDGPPNRAVWARNFDELPWFMAEGYSGTGWARRMADAVIGLLTLDVRFLRRPK